MEINLLEDGDASREMLRDVADTIWNKINQGTISKEDALQEIQQLEFEISLLKKLEEPLSLQEKQEYVPVEMALSALKKAYKQMK